MLETLYIGTSVDIMTCGVNVVDKYTSFQICGVSEDRHIIFIQGGEEVHIGEYPQGVAS